MKYRPEPGTGDINLGRFSGLRKLMRAARRGKLPPERQFKILHAQASAIKRAEKYVGPSTRRIAQ